jgi:hypothetical protein
MICDEVPTPATNSAIGKNEVRARLGLTRTRFQWTNVIGCQTVCDSQFK